MNYLVQLMSGAMGAALVAGVFGLITAKRNKADAHTDALKYLMLYCIQERAKQHIKDGYIRLEDRRLLHRWHETYHDGLHGNGDADSLMEAIDHLPIR